MTEHRIIFRSETGGVCVLIPAPEYADQLEAIAQKDVPEGTPYRIIGAEDLPPREQRDLWRWTESGPLDIAQE